MTAQQALEELETRIAYQDDAIDQLSDTVYRQSLELARLDDLCRAIEGRLRSLADGEGSEDDAPPPHY